MALAEKKHDRAYKTEKWLQDAKRVNATFSRYNSLMYFAKLQMIAGCSISAQFRKSS